MLSMGIYSKDLRIRAVAASDRGIPRRELSQRHLLHLLYDPLKRWLRMKEEGEDLSPGVSRGAGDASSRRSREQGFVEPARRERRCHSGASLRTVEAQDGLQSGGVRGNAMSRAIREKRNKLGWSYKKRRWVPPSETNTREVLSGSA